MTHERRADSRRAAEQGSLCGRLEYNRRIDNPQRRRGRRAQRRINV
jgi:hypothetical protein